VPPTQLIEAVEAVRRRARVLSIGYGAGVVVASAVGLLVALVALDWLLNLHAVPRLMLILSLLVAVGALAWRYVVEPARSKLTLGDVAGRLEQAFPQFDDRLRSTIDFARADHVPGSDLMKQRTIDEAGTLAGQVDLQSAVVAAPAVRALSGGAAAVIALLLVSLLALDGRTLQIIASRLLTPFDGMPWPKRVEIQLLDELPQRVPVGQRIDVRMQLARGDKPSIKPIVYYQVEEGPVQREFMTRNEDGTYSASLDARLDSAAAQGRLKVWMTAGDDRADAAPIVVVPRLSIAGAEAQVLAPPYARPANAPATTTNYNLLTLPAAAVEGSTVTLRFDFNKPLASGERGVVIEPIADPQSPIASLVPVLADRSATFTWDARMPAGDTQTLRFRVRGRDTDGFENDALEEFAVRVERDQKPSVQIEQPRRNEERTAVARVPMQALVEDDFGFRFVTLEVRRTNRVEQKWSIPLVENGAPTQAITWQRADGSSERQRFRLNYGWELASLADANLQNGDVLEYHLLVQDNFELDGRQHDPVASDKLRITIISQSDLIDRVADDLRQVRNQVSDLRRGQDRARQDTATLADETKARPELDAADQAVADRLTQQQSGLSSATRQLAQRADQLRQRLEENNSPAEDLKSLANDVSDQLEQTAEGAMKRSTQELSRAATPNENRPPAEAQQQRNAAMEQAQQQQQQASEELQRAIERMAAIGSLATAIEEFNQIASDQQDVNQKTQEATRNTLGKRPEQLTPEQRKQIDEAAREQDELAERTQKAIEKLDEMAKQMERSDPAAAEAMKNAARMAQTQGVPQNQKKAAQQARQNQQQGAQQAQRQVDIGIEMILGELREAERRRLRELQRQLADLDKQVQLLVRRQGGHNLDNLTIQGPDRLGKLTEADRAQLENLAARPQPQEGQPPPAAPQLAGLTSGQQQTERNARDIARTAEQVPNAGDVAARLARAAGRMERAVFPLREQKLEDAYSPPQVEALAELLAAQRLVADMKKQVEQDIQEEQQEAIRQRFIRVRDEQVKTVNTETAALDKARAGREAGRADRIRAAQIGEAQGKLIEQVQSLDEALAGLRSIVYVWANKDIASAMEQVKAELADAKTGSLTQARQAQIVEQLNAMIANLAQRQPEEEFEQPSDGGGGGGGGGGSARLPPEAEIRLLKSLQEMVNRQTKTLDASPPADRSDESFDQLGGRQGEMRKLLAELLEASSQGQLKLGPEPENQDQLPEEADPDAVADQELQDDLLGGDPEKEEIEKDVTRIGTRMSRSRQRLADNNDAGKVTQVIQEKILEDFDELIRMAQQQQQRRRQQQQQQAQGQQQRPQQDQQQANNQGQNQPGQQQNDPANTPADQSTTGSPGSTNADASRPLQESDAEWGSISPRLRDAVLESKNEDIVGEYRRLIEQYYKAVSTEATQR
jgi:hypothetical protein